MWVIEEYRVDLSQNWFYIAFTLLCSKSNTLICFILLFRFFNFSSTDSSLSGKNQNDQVDSDGDIIEKPVRIISAGTIAEALKQLQLIEEREERERRSTSKIAEKASPTGGRLLRYVDADVATDDNNADAPLTPSVENNENRRRLSLAKNVRRLTLTTATTTMTTLSNAANNLDELRSENDVFESVVGVDNQPTETSTTLIEIGREKETLVSDILRTICDLREVQLVAMSYRVRQRALASKPPTYVMKDFPSLYGRCFNLSMNLKILTQCQFGDSGIAARVLSDFDILEKSLEAKLPPTSDLSSLLQQIKI